ncbi:hypothetical protein DENIS_4606 [Desulfonema ishimotonii]|uniref:Uncharacterized protein n=1 Tax=Desulfonema ishimotonii TaxID=45657 RepID=A0A401G2Y7_9BACT|nr:hypothetical protein [Desulfonema ishimotonii]GBC63608.1 hypothetical protein DENIS_4606 [Desulfonema ishimotonii]
MDEKFLEFWGNLLINAAHSKQQMDQMFQWMQQGGAGMDKSSPPKSPFPGSGELFSTFQKLYGLDNYSERSEEYQKTLDQALKDFHESFKEYLSRMGIVSREEHLTLVGKYEKLKARCADQEETIRHLKMLLDARQGGQPDMFQEMVRCQGEVFQNMMKDFSQYFGKKESDSSDQKKTKADERGKREHDKPDRSEPDDQTDP